MVDVSPIHVSMQSTNDPVKAAEMLNALHEGTWAAQHGLVLSVASRDEVRGTITVDAKHRQPFGIVHGGVYCGVVETIASVGAGMDVMPQGKAIVGLENQTSFVRAVREGTLTVLGTPITRGRRSQLWEVTIRNEDQAIVATGRVRLLVLDEGSEVAGSALRLG